MKIPASASPAHFLASLLSRCNFRRWRGVGLVVVAGLVSVVTSSFGASATWNGTTNGIWATTTNWSASPVPGAGDTATFNNAGNANTILDLGAGVTLRSITFNTAAAAAYTIGSGAVGSQTLTLETTGVTQLTSTVSNNQTINANILLGVNAGATTYTFTNASLSNSLNLAGNLSGNTGGTAGAKTVTVNGAGDTNISGVISNGGATTVALTKREAGTLTLSGANSYTGATSIGAQGGNEGGTLLLSGSGKLGNSAVTLFEGTLNLNSTTQTITTLTVGGGSAASSASVSIGNGTLNLGGNVTFSGANNHVGAIISGSGGGVINLLGNRTFVVNDSNIASDDLTISAILADGDATPRSIAKSNAGTLTLNAANTFTGSTTINASGGTLKLDFAASNAPTNDILYNGVAKGALSIGAGLSLPSALIVQGKSGTTNSQAFGNFTQTGASGLASIMVNSGSSGTMNLSLGTITRTSGSSIAFAGPASGNITTTQADGRILAATFTSGSTGLTTWASVTSGILGGYTGDTLYAGGNISSNASSNLYIDNTTSGNVTQGAGTTNLATLSFLDAADRTVVVGAGNTLLFSGPAGGVQNISTAGNLTIGAPGNAGSITAGTTGAHEFIITNGSANSTLTINSVITNNAGGSPILNITGPGRTVFTGNNSFTGTLNLNGGTLEIQNNNALGTTAGATIIAHGATLGLSGGITTAEDITINGPGFGNSGVLRNISENNTLSGTITVSSGSRINSDAGTLAITGNFANNSAQTLTFGGAGDTTLITPISINNASLIKDGSGTLTLLASGIVAGSGAVFVNDGTLRYNANDAIGSGNLTVNGGTFDLSTFTDTVGAVTISSGSIIGSGTLTGTSYTSSDGGIISANLGNNNATLVKNGDGTLTLAGTSAYTGTTAIRAGVLHITGNLTGGTAISLPGPSAGVGGTGSITQSESSVISGATSITWAGNMAEITYSTLAGNNSYTGLTTINMGVLRVLHSNALGSTASGTSVGSLAALELAGDISIGAEPLTIAGSGISDGGVLRNISGSNSFGGEITIGSGGVGATRINSDDGTLTLTGNLTTVGTRALVFGGAGNTVVTSTIFLGLANGTLTKDGTGTLTLSGSNTYVGNTTASEGTLQFARTASLYNGNTADWTAARIRVNSGATVAFNVGGSGEFSTANVTTLLTNLTTVNSNGLNAGSFIAFDTTNASSGTFTIADNITNSVGNGGGAVGLTKLGAGTLDLTGSNSFTGATSVAAGTLLISGTGAINSTSGIAVNTGGTFRYDSSTGLSRDVTLNAGGTFAHNGSNAYTGSLTWNGGTLAGTNYAGVNLAVGGGRTLSPGNSPGTMVTASQTWTNGGNFNLEIHDFDLAPGTGFDTIAITGTLDLTGLTEGGFNINLWSLSAVGPDVDGDALNFNNMVGGSWLIVSTTGGISGFDATKFTIHVGAINGTSGFSNDLGGGTFSISMVNNDLFLNFTPIPEPSSALLLGLGLAAWMIRKRR